MKRRLATIDRRRWLQLVGTGVAGTAFSCGDNLAPDEGAIIHEPTVDGFLVAVWSRYEHQLTVEIRTEGELVGDTTFDVVPNVATALDVYELEPDRAYDVTVIGGQVHTYRARTAPADDATRPVRLAVSADFDPSPEFDSDLCDHIVAAAPELFVAIGDFPYTDDGPPAVTLSSYRERHAALRNAPRLRAVLEAMPLRAIYDDHEFRDNWDASRVAAEPDRFAAAMQAWDEFFPLRRPRDDVRYRSVRFNAGIIDVDAESLTVAGLGADGSRFFQATFSPAELTPVTTSTL